MFLISKTKFVAWLVLIALAVQAAIFYPQMPTKMATSFGTNGTPHAWMTPRQSLWFEIGLVALMWASFFWLPRLIRRFPNSVNIPNRAYWLAPERRDATMLDIESRMNSLGVLVLVFIGVLMDAMFRANLATPVHLSAASLTVLIVGWAGGMLLWLAGFARRYRRV